MRWQLAFWKSLIRSIHSSQVQPNFKNVYLIKRIHWIWVSINGPTNIPYNRSLHIEVHCKIIKYNIGKVKLAHYLTQQIDTEDPDDQRHEWFS